MRGIQLCALLHMDAYLQSKLCQTCYGTCPSRASVSPQNMELWCLTCEKHLCKTHHIFMRFQPYFTTTLPCDFRFHLVLTTDQHRSAMYIWVLFFLCYSHKLQWKTEHHFSLSPLHQPLLGRSKQFVVNKQADTFLSDLRPCIYPAAEGYVCYAELLVPLSWGQHLAGR